VTETWFFLCEGQQQDVDKNFAYVAVMLSNILNITHSNEGPMSSGKVLRCGTLCSHGAKSDAEQPRSAVDPAARAWRGDAEVSFVSSGQLHQAATKRRKTTIVYYEADPKFII
jgi:hypothetical protein